MQLAIDHGYPVDTFLFNSRGSKLFLFDVIIKRPNVLNNFKTMAVERIFAAQEVDISLVQITRTVVVVHSLARTPC